jgi:hypothetical protein
MYGKIKKYYNLKKYWSDGRKEITGILPIPATFTTTIEIQISFLSGVRLSPVQNKLCFR